MDDNTAELIAALGRRIAMIMKDVVDCARTLAHLDPPGQEAAWPGSRGASARIG